jgi:hypothetical protein
MAAAKCGFPGCLNQVPDDADMNICTPCKVALKAGRSLVQTQGTDVLHVAAPPPTQVVPVPVPELEMTEADTAAPGLEATSYRHAVQGPAATPQGISIY